MLLLVAPGRVNTHLLEFCNSNVPKTEVALLFVLRRRRRRGEDGRAQLLRAENRRSAVLGICGLRGHVASERPRRARARPPDGRLGSRTRALGLMLYFVDRSRLTNTNWVARYSQYEHCCRLRRWPAHARLTGSEQKAGEEHSLRAYVSLLERVRPAPGDDRPSYHSSRHRPARRREQTRLQRGGSGLVKSLYGTLLLLRRHHRIPSPLLC